ncbi:MAG: deoxyribonuclease IV [candidate division WOR-3 bacterium]
MSLTGLSGNLLSEFILELIYNEIKDKYKDGFEAFKGVIKTALNRVKNNVTVLLENTAGSGSEIGYNFEQIRDIIKQVDDSTRIGVTLDVAHAFEAGYDFRTQEGISRIVEEFDRFIGLKKLHLLHLNDSKSPFNSKVDRHWHIGEGEIGLDGFRLIVNHPAFKNLPGIMETPRTDTKEDLKNMKVIRSLVR